MPVTEATRRDIIHTLKSEDIDWSGALDDVDFLSRIYDLDKMDSTDHRFGDARGDIYQHRIANNDWSANWIYDDSRFDLLHCPDVKFLRFLCEMLHPTVRTDKDEAKALLELFNRKLGDEGYKLVEKKTAFGNIRYEPEGILPGTVQALDELKDVSEVLSSTHMQQEIARLYSSVEKDPELAVGTAKELVETVCKTILKERGVTFKEDEDLPKLVHIALEVVTPEEELKAKKTSENLRKLAGSLGVITQSLAELRNLHGTGHGKEAKAIPLNPVYGALAANAAATLSLHLYQSYKQKYP